MITALPIIATALFAAAAATAVYVLTETGAALRAFFARHRRPPL